MLPPRCQGESYRRRIPTLGGDRATPTQAGETVRQASLQLSRGFGVLTVSWLWMGCTGEPDKVDPESFNYVEPDCHGSSNTCFPILRVETDILRHCFRWDGPNQQWPVGTPQDVLDDCPNPETMGQYCDFSYDVEYGVTCENDCGSCVPVDAEVSPGEPFPIDQVGVPDDDCCVCDVALTGLDSFITELAACGFIGTELWKCPDPDWLGVADSECPDDTSSPYRAPHADFVLHVDPLASFLSVSVLGESETVALSGGGSLTLTATESLTATFWAEDGTLAGQVLENWVFWGTVPIEHDAARGTFLVPSEGAPLFPGRGEVNGIPSRLDVEMNQLATGTVDPSGLVWQCDYVESLAGQSVQLHVEGTLEPPP